MADREIELISDGDGVAVIGEPGVVEPFLREQGLASRELDLRRLSKVVGSGGAVASGASTVAASSGRWVQLTEHSAKALKTGQLMKGSGADCARAIVVDGSSKTKHILEITKSGSLVANPAMLAGAAAIMSQVAMQQAMDEITDYLKVIDAKVDDILRAQTDAVVADMIGVDLVIEEAMVIREATGRISTTTWSKVQGTAMTIARTQAYALRRLDALSEQLREHDVDTLAKISRKTSAKVDEWLAVLAHCHRLQDAITVLEIDRVFEDSPEDLEEHRKALRAARAQRTQRISTTTEALLAQIERAVAVANEGVLLNPFSSRAVVEGGSATRQSVITFQQKVGIAQAGGQLTGRRWSEAALGVRDRVIETGADGVASARRVGSKAVDRAKGAAGRLPRAESHRLSRRSGRKAETEADQ